MSKKYRVVGDLYHIVGTLQYGAKEMVLNEQEYQRFLEMTREEQVEWIDEEGGAIFRKYRPEDYEKVLSVDVEPYE